MNKIILIGRLGKDADIRGSQDKPIIAFSIAVTTLLPGGEKDTQWFNCAAFNQLAKFLSGAVPKKGALVNVEGKMKRRTYTDRTGAERSEMEVVVEHFQFLERRETAAEPIGGGSGGAWEEPVISRDIWR